MAEVIYTILSERDGEKSTKEFEVEIPAGIMERYRAKALASIAADLELPGFRKGKAPETVVLKAVGDMSVLEKAADEAINTVVPSVLAEKQLRFIGQSSISITTLAPGNPLRFKMQVALVPEITLPNYKEIAAAQNKIELPSAEVSDAELKESLLNIRKMLAKQGDKDKEPPALTDESVKQLGNFENVAAFTERLKKDLGADKKIRAKEKRLLEIIEHIVAATRMELPDTLVEHELDRIEAEFMHDVERMGIKPDEYLKRIQKTKEALRTEWRDNAEKRAKFELLLPRIAKEEQLLVTPEEIERETKHLLEHYKDADKETAKLYVERLLLRQKVLDFFEKQK